MALRPAGVQNKLSCLPTMLEADVKDMYGHKIVPIGDGFGVSLAFAHHLNGAVTPCLTVFHSSDGFRQSLFSVGFSNEARPQVGNVFDDRFGEVLRLLRAQRERPM